MLTMQWSIVLIVLSTVQIYTAYGQCPPIDLCLHVRCGNGTCAYNSAMQNCFECQCNPGYTGRYCETNLAAACPQTFCENGGTCYMNGSVPACFCSYPYSGYLCESFISVVSTTGVPSTNATTTTSANTTTSSGGLCPMNPCSNGASCFINGNSLVCICAPGYTGDLCDMPDSSSSTLPSTTTGLPFTALSNTTSAGITTPGVDTCATSPCLNGGSCFSNSNGFVCICRPAYTGDLCDMPISSSSTPPSTTTGLPFTAVSNTTSAGITTPGVDTCATSPCLNGGSCFSNSNGFVCICRPAYTGDLCDMLVSSSSTLLSTTTGLPFTTVSNTTSASTTTPMPGNCSSRPCLNGGSCFNNGNSFFCFCPVQYTGHTCERQNTGTTTSPSTAAPVNACASSPCNNGGTCYRYGSSFFCVCTSYYTGGTCETVKTFTTPSVTTPSSAVSCANQPCQNGATCYTAGNSYYCYCGANSNYAGKNCETLKAPVDPNCPLSCAPGQCVRTGSTQQRYACMCNGVLALTSCSP